MKYTFNKDGWTDWITHDHKGCPCVGWYIRAETNRNFKNCPPHYKIISDRVFEGPCRRGNVKRVYTSWNGGANVLVERYKVRKPLGASKLEEMLKDLPKTVDKSLVKA